MTIELVSLTYTYAKAVAPALRDITLTFRAGGVSLVAGKSGGGKTTLIRCINGLIPRSYTTGTLIGSIRCFGESTLGLSLAQLARRIGTVMQDPDKQIVASQVLNELAFGPENLGLARDEIVERVMLAATQMHVDHLLERQTYTLSGGEQQRVAIAAVLAMRPQVLLLDEPLASLDPPAARDALTQFRRLADAGLTVVMVEHRVHAALRIEPELCVWLDNGVVPFAGSASDYRARLDEGQQMPVDTLTAQRLSSVVTNQPLLSFRAAYFTYPDSPREQIAGVSLDVHTGDVIALIGPNGAGKSTLCRLAIGLIRPSNGSILIRGQNAASRTVAQIVLDVGYVFQNPATMLFANTLREELSFGPRNVGMTQAEIERNVAQAVRMVGLDDMPLDRSPFALSFGQQKRAAVASVLAMSPHVLILDEPTAGLDDGTADDLMRRLTIADAAPQALVMVTHDLALARRFANRVVLMRDGAIVADGLPAQVLDDEMVMQRGGLV